MLCSCHGVTGADLDLDLDFVGLAYEDGFVPYLHYFEVIRFCRE